LFAGEAIGRERRICLTFVAIRIHDELADEVGSEAVLISILKPEEVTSVAEDLLIFEVELVVEVVQLDHDAKAFAASSRLAARRVCGACSSM
jgi:hypothetical protein